MRSLFLQDIREARQRLLDALDQYDDVLYELDPGGQDLELDDEDLEETREEAFQQLVATVENVFRSIGGDPPSQITVITLAKTRNLPRAKRFVRRHFAYDHYPRPWLRSFIEVVMWPIDRVKHLLG